MIFVFGSNEAGIHGAGAAAFAMHNHGAIWKQGVGLQGNSYAIPTKDYHIKTLPLQEIAQYVEMFLRFAAHHHELQFKITQLGCGLAGYKVYDIAPMFINSPSNCFFDRAWKPFFDTHNPSQQYNYWN